jgi:hypothetical protein
MFDSVHSRTIDAGTILDKRTSSKLARAGDRIGLSRRCEALVKVSFLTPILARTGFVPSPRKNQAVPMTATLARHSKLPGKITLPSKLDA